MSGFVNPLARSRASLPEKARTIKQWVRDVLNLPAEAVVSVNELACSLPGCPPREIVLLIMLPHRPPFQASMHLTLQDVTEPDVAAALKHACMQMALSPRS